MRVVSFASGSSGNCTYIGEGDRHFLVDAGISAKRITECLASLDLTPEDLTGVFITHEHTDHIQGLPVLASRHNLQLYMSPGTAAALQAMKVMDRIPRDLYHSVDPGVPGSRSGTPLQLGDVRILPLATSHDAAQPCGYRLDFPDKSAAVVTDLGRCDQLLCSQLQNLKVLLLEANHDVHMLQVGPYPYRLKQRILSERGHLSNESSGQMLSGLLNDGLETVLLGHLSKENNYPQLAFETVRLEIDMADNAYRAGDFRILLADRQEMTAAPEC